MRRRNEKRGNWHVNVHMGTDTHTLPLNSSGESNIPYLQHIVRKGYTAMYMQALYNLLSVTSGHIQLTSQDVGIIWRGLSFPCWESVLK